MYWHAKPLLNTPSNVKREAFRVIDAGQYRRSQKRFIVFRLMGANRMVEARPCLAISHCCAFDEDQKPCCINERKFATDFIPLSSSSTAR